MNETAFLLSLGSVPLLGGAWVAFDIRGAARALERRAEANAELAMHARAELGPPARVMSAQVYRYLGTAICLGGAVITLVGLLELARA